MPPGGRRGGKFSKPTRGGGKHFSRDLQPLDKDGNPVGMWRDPADKANDETSSEEDDDDEEEDSSEEESADEGGPGSAKLGNTTSGNADLTREQRKELARKKKAAAVAKKNKKVAEVGDMPTSDEEEEEDDDDGDDDMPANPNHSSKARAQARAATGPAAGGETALPSRKDKSQLSRREREAIEAQAAKERYQKLHAEGKTDEARADLERLKLIRQQREDAAARKKAEQEEKDAEKKEREAEIEAREKKLREAAMGGAAKRGAKKGTRK